jgi:hypothetical protein
LEILKGRKNLKDVGIEGRKMLKIYRQKYDGERAIELNLRALETLILTNITYIFG